MSTEDGTTPWVKVPADEIPEGARLWDPFHEDDEPWDTFLRLEWRPAPSQFRKPSWWLIYRGSLSGAENRLDLEDNKKTMIRIVREDAQ